ncbi:MAG: hypothetical protein DHS20C18_45830 [Saprospiraceae bacterium]|nr:MAG: hypothetical protein DHS20C18_45830 [Saprospiraceae bacterium]
MKVLKNISWILFLTWSISACSVGPQPIEYGEDVCDFCKMTIVDRQFAAELVTSKGKIFKFDAIECMVPFRQQKEGTSFSYTLVNDYQKPGELMDAEWSYYLISPAIPSPMGGNLSAFSTVAAAEGIQKEKGGVVYSWKELQVGIRNEK